MPIAVQLLSCGKSNCYSVALFGFNSMFLEVAHACNLQRIIAGNFCLFDFLFIPFVCDKEKSATKSHRQAHLILIARHLGCMMLVFFFAE